MPLVDLQIKPGLYTDASAREAGLAQYWYDCDKVRFINGRPTKIGGWAKKTLMPVIGKARALIDWTTTRNEFFIAIGTTKKLYIVQGQSLYDITPIRISGNLSNPFTTTAGSAIVTVTHSSHGCLQGDFVHFSGASLVGGILITGEYEVIQVVDNNSYRIQHTSAASSSATGGGTVAYQYEINVGSDVTTYGLGWGAGAWSVGTWSTPRSSSSITFKSRIWSLDLWGEDLLASPYDGALYVWDSSNGLNVRAQRIQQAPSSNKSIFVVPDARQIFALGADDPLLIRWCVQEDYNQWTPMLFNTAGDKRLEYGSEIVCGLPSRLGSLIFTDTWLYSSELVGLPDIYSFISIGPNNGICGPKAAVILNNMAYWMTSNGFYMFDGVIRKIPCPVHEKIFDDINVSVKRHFFAAALAEYNEVWWFYASSASNEIDKYVGYNVTENAWFFGSLNRTAFVGNSRFVVKPYAVGVDGFLYTHEYGYDADNNVLSAFIETGAFELDAGNKILHISKFIPDLYDLNKTVKILIKAKKYPHSNENEVSGPHSVNNSTKFINPRLRGRQFALRISSDEKEAAWSVGNLRLDIRPHGAR